MASAPNTEGLPDGVTLLSDETVLWSGRPNQSLFAFTKFDAMLVPLSIVWAGFVLVWNLTVWASDAPIWFRLWGLPFLLVGAYITVGRFFHGRRIRSQKSYVLTNKRALIARTGSKTTVKEIPLTSGLALETQTRSDGSGTVYFGPPARFIESMANPFAAMKVWTGAASDDSAFFRVDDSAHVAAIAQDIIYER